MKENKENKNKFNKVQQLFNFLDEDAEDSCSVSFRDIEEELKHAQIDVAGFKRQLKNNIEAFSAEQNQEGIESPREERPSLTDQWRSLWRSLYRPSWQMSLTSLLGLVVLTIIIVVNKPVPDDNPVYRGQGSVEQTDAGEVTVLDDDVARLNQEIQVLFDLQEYARAIPLAQRVLSLKKDQHGEDHLEAAMAMNNLAVLYKRSGHLDKAETLYLKSLSIELQWLGETHHQTLASFQHLAQLYEQRGEDRQSLIYYQKILNVRIATFGSDHGDVRSLEDKIRALQNRMLQDNEQ
ncbi:MAG: tetratricopeptide repeat protein [Candidatus Omnitrophica bacterium]|nr:tetratricopeptide repeat protein [Candidatus Omnitrophota bacterium]